MFLVSIVRSDTDWHFYHKFGHSEKLWLQKNHVVHDESWTMRLEFINVLSLLTCGFMTDVNHAPNLVSCQAVKKVVVEFKCGRQAFGGECTSR